MTDNNKLIEILDKSFAEQHEKRGLLTAQHTADALLANGVIVPPCKVGDKVYTILLGEIISYDIASYIVDEKVSFVNLAFMQGNKMYGKTVTIKEFYESYYFTKEEAEEKLKELNK